MADVRQGRWTARIEGDFVVFLIGARLSARHPVRSFQDLGGNRGMRHMLDYLMQHPEKGLLGYQANLPSLTTVQYWRSFDHLERFATDETDPHLAPWRAYWKRVGRTDWPRRRSSSRSRPTPRLGGGCGTPTDRAPSPPPGGDHSSEPASSSSAFRATDNASSA